MSLQDINFLTPGQTPGGQVIIAAGGGPTVIFKKAIFYPVGRLYLKRIEATCTVAGVASAAAFTLSESGKTVAIYAVGVSAVGTRIVFEFPVPASTLNFFNMTLDGVNAIGTWAFVCNGFVL